jgi:hypothetical protein
LWQQCYLPAEQIQSYIWWCCRSRIQHPIVSNLQMIHYICGVKFGFFSSVLAHDIHVAVMTATLPNSSKGNGAPCPSEPSTRCCCFARGMDMYRGKLAYVHNASVVKYNERVRPVRKFRAPAMSGTAQLPKRSRTSPSLCLHSSKALEGKGAVVLSYANFLPHLVRKQCEGTQQTFVSSLCSTAEAPSLMES